MHEELRVKYNVEQTKEVRSSHNFEGGRIFAFEYKKVAISREWYFWGAWKDTLLSRNPVYADAESSQHCSFMGGLFDFSTLAAHSGGAVQFGNSMCAEGVQCAPYLRQTQFFGGGVSADSSIEQKNVGTCAGRDSANLSVKLEEDDDLISNVSLLIKCFAGGDSNFLILEVDGGDKDASMEAASIRVGAESYGSIMKKPGIGTLQVS